MNSVVNRVPQEVCYQYNLMDFYVDNNNEDLVETKDLVKEEIKFDEKRFVVLVALTTLPRPKLKDIAEIMELHERSLADLMSTLKGLYGVEIEREGGRKTGYYEIGSSGILDLAKTTARVKTNYPAYFKHMQLIARKQQQEIQNKEVKSAAVV